MRNMITFDHVIQDEHGLHARPAGELVKCANQFKCHISLCYGGQEANAKSILMLMAMSLPFGAPITMIMDGEDEKEAAAQIQAFLEETL